MTARSLVLPFLMIVICASAVMAGAAPPYQRTSWLFHLGPAGIRRTEAMPGLSTVWQLVHIPLWPWGRLAPA